MSTKKSKVAKRGEGSLIKVGKAGNYYLRYYVDGKQTKQRLTDEEGKPITDRRKAEQVKQDLLAPLQHTNKAEQLKAIKAKLEDQDLQQQDSLAALKPHLPLSSVWNEYYRSQNRPKSGVSTLNRYKATIDTFNVWMTKAYPNTTTMYDVTIQHAEDYARHLENKKLSPSSFNIYLNNLSTIWAVLAEKGDIPENPFAWENSTPRTVSSMTMRSRMENASSAPTSWKEDSDSGSSQKLTAASQRCCFPKNTKRV